MFVNILNIPNINVIKIYMKYSQFVKKANRLHHGGVDGQQRVWLRRKRKNLKLLTRMKLV